MFEKFKKNNINQEENTYTYEDYKNNIKKLQELELKSDRFKEVYNFIEKYKIRNSNSKEKILLNILNNKYHFDYQTCLEKIKIVKEIINSTSDNALELNIYLKAIKQGYIISRNDCEKIVEKLIKQYNELPNTLEYQYIMTNINIDRNSLNLLGDYVDTTAYIKHYPEYEEEEYDAINILDDENIKYYELYNEIISSIHEIYESLYYYNLIKELANNDIEVSEIYLEFDEEKFSEVSAYFLVKKEIKRKKHKKK